MEQVGEEGRVHSCLMKMVCSTFLRGVSDFSGGYLPPPPPRIPHPVAPQGPPKDSTRSIKLPQPPPPFPSKIVQWGHPWGASVTKLLKGFRGTEVEEPGNQVIGLAGEGGMYVKGLSLRLFCVCLQSVSIKGYLQTLISTLQESPSLSAYTVKKRLTIFPSPAGMSQTKLSLAGNN